MILPASELQITVVVVFHNEQHNLPQLLKSIDDSSFMERASYFQFLFIDNASTDQSKQKIQKWISKTKFKSRLVMREKNHMAEARQQSLLESETSWVVFIDADATLSKNWSEKVIQAIGFSSDRVLAIGGGSVYVGDQNWHSYVHSLWNYFPIGKKQNQRTLVSHVPTNNYLLKRQGALDAGGFDPFYARVGEDLDINIRLSRKGEVIYDPRFTIEHQLPLSILQWYQKMAFYGRAQSYVAIKNRGFVPKEKFLPAFLVVFIFSGLCVLPGLSLGTLAIFLLIPRTRFFLLTFLFYGLGEIVGALLVFSSKWGMGRFSVLSKAQEPLLGNRKGQ